MTYEQALMEMPRGYRRVQDYIECMEMYERGLTGLLKANTDASGNRLTAEVRKAYTKQRETFRTRIAALTR